MPLRILPSWRWVDDHRRRIVIIGSILISLMLALFLAVPAVHAESPFNDPAYRRPVDGGRGGTGGGFSRSLDVLLNRCRLLLVEVINIRPSANANPRGGLLASVQPCRHRCSRRCLHWCEHR
jgi:hypothetical protein